jgi:hypothetical protein
VWVWSRRVPIRLFIPHFTPHIGQKVSRPLEVPTLLQTRQIKHIHAIFFDSFA